MRCKACDEKIETDEKVIDDELCKTCMLAVQDDLTEFESILLYDRSKGNLYE